MPAKIDELQLQIGADASSAIKQLGNLADALDKVSNSANKLNSASSGLNGFADAVNRVSGAKVTVTANRLKKLANIDYSNLRVGAQSANVLANSLAKLGSISIDTKGVNKFASSMKSMYETASSGGKAPIDRAYTSSMYTAADAIKTVTGYAIKLGGQGASAIANFASKLGLIPSHKSGIDRTVLSFGNLLRAVTPFFGLRGLFDWAKDAVRTGSSIVEVENVIDTSFGNMKRGYEDISGYVYKWAQTTVDNFGVSELAAKQYAGRLMSMFNSSGFDVTEGMRDSAAKMSTDLIERAGDIASFYDITVDEAMTKIQSGLAGVTRPLRSLGINMTVANMQAYALSQGITTSWQSMDQATQMALRYSYILDASKYAMGDFQKTAGSFANQVRLLSLNFQVLSSTIGQGLISAIAPVISWLNLLIKRLIQAANAFRTFMFSLFGKAIGAAKGVSNDLADYLGDASDSVQDLGGGAGGAADGLGSAGKAAKELKKQLTVLPFDELNQLAKNTEAAGSGGSGGGGGGGAGGGGLGDMGSLLDVSEMDLSGSPVIEAVNEWAKKMRKAFTQGDWAMLGHTIAEGINSGFQKIYEVLDWNKVGPKVYAFIQPFQATINSMMDKIDWDLIGKTFARGLNDIVYTFRMFINGFNWREYGKDFAEGTNGFLREWDADAFGRAIADKFRAAWNLFGGWVKTFDFSLLGTRLKEGILGAIRELNWGDMGSSFGTFMTGIGTTLRTMFEDGKIRDEFSSALSDFVNNFLEDFDSEEFMRGLRAAADTIVGGLGDAVKKVDKTKLKEDVINLLKELPWTSIATAVGSVAGGKLALGLFGSAFKKVAEAKITSALGIGSVGSGASGQLAIIGGVSVGAIALGLWLKQQADKSGLTKLFQLDTGGNKASAAKVTSEGQTKNQKALNAAGINNAGYSTKIQTVPNQPKATPASNVVTTTLKGVTDASFTSLLTGVRTLSKNPVVTKTMDGKTTDGFNTGYSKYTDTRKFDVSKDFEGKESGGFGTKFRQYIYDKTHNVSKNFEGKETGGFSTKLAGYKYVANRNVTKNFAGAETGGFSTKLTGYKYTTKHNVKKNFEGDESGGFTTKLSGYKYTTNRDVKKKFTGEDGGNFVKFCDNYKNLGNKSATFTLDVKTNVKRIFASWSNGAGDSEIAKILTNASGGLFKEASAFQIFGEAGAEAAIPLERRSTMKMIGEAIVGAGGMASSNSDDIADAIAARILPAMASMMASIENRPLNINATLMTENNEVLARAVNQGNRMLDKRYNPVSQFSYS